MTQKIVKGELKFYFSDRSTQSVNILAIAAPEGTATSSLAHGSPIPRSLRVAGGCVPTKLIPVFTSLSFGFSIAASWPALIDVAVADDCGNAIVTGSFLTIFSNGDPALLLGSLKDGRWTGTWIPRDTRQPQITVRVNATIPGMRLSGTAQVIGGVRVNVSPTVSVGAVVNSASLARQGPLAPGTLISVFGTGLADDQATAPGFPLPNELAGRHVVIAGTSLPLLDVSTHRVTAQIPYDISVNTHHQLIVQRGTAISTPVDEVMLASARPAIFTSDESGTGQGLIYKIDETGERLLADRSHPLHFGDRILIECTGLGTVSPPLAAGTKAPTNPPATVYSVRLTIGGIDAEVSFAGLAPDLVGIYHVRATVPEGTPLGDAVPFTLTVAGQTSDAVTGAMF